MPVRSGRQVPQASQLQDLQGHVVATVRPAQLEARDRVAVTVQSERQAAKAPRQLSQDRRVHKAFRAMRLPLLDQQERLARPGLRQL